MTLANKKCSTISKEVKEALPNIPIGYVDAYYQFLERPRLVDACDLILINCYPFWEGASIEHATLYLKQMYAVTKNASQRKACYYYRDWMAK